MTFGALAALANIGNDNVIALQKAAIIMDLIFILKQFKTANMQLNATMMLWYFVICKTVTIQKMYLVVSLQSSWRFSNSQGGHEVIVEDNIGLG